MTPKRFIPVLPGRLYVQGVAEKSVRTLQAWFEGLHEEEKHVSPITVNEWLRKLQC